MDTPSLDDLPPAMSGQRSSTFRGARASLNPRFSPVRTPLRSRTSHEHVYHSRQGQCCSLRQACKDRHCIAQSHAADPRDTATAPDTVARGHAVLRAAKRHTTRPPHQGGLCAPWTQVHLHWLASQRGARAGREGPIRRTASLELRLVHPEPRDSRRSQCWSCSAGSLEAGPEQAKRAIKP